MDNSTYTISKAKENNWVLRRVLKTENQESELV